MKGQKKKYIKGILLAIIMCSMTVITMASVPKTIKVGLESLGKNKGAISLSGNQNFEIGYFSEVGFSPLGTLSSSSLNIKVAASTYYDLGLSFNNYSSAFEAARGSGVSSVVGYNAIGTFSVYSLDASQSLGVPVSDNLVEVYDANGQLLLVMPKKTDLVFCSFDLNTGMYLTKVGSTNDYRGGIGIGGDSGITPYNILFTEEYLYGVLPKEMSPSYPIEALKAQAVAARSIATYQYNRYLSSGYNVVDTTSTQAYGGYKAEKATTTSAVDMTRDEVIRYNGALAEAVYFSTSGGMTEAAKEVWGSEIPYLQAVVDLYETEPSMPSWTSTVTMEEIGAALSKKGITIGTPMSVEITSRSTSGRVKELTIYGTVGSHTIKGTEVRTFFSGTSAGSLKSTYFSFYGPIGNSSTNSNNSSSTNSSKVTVLSANGQQQVSTSNLVAMSSTEMTSLPRKVAVYSANGLSYLSGSSSAGNTSTNAGLGMETATGNMTIYGAGYGHGVGMSQSGAKGMAKAGYTYDEILKYYYQGVTVSR